MLQATDKPEKQAIELSRAYLCSDCNVIGNDPRQCTRCGSQSLLSVARVFQGRSSRGEVTRIRVGAGA